MEDAEQRPWCSPRSSKSRSPSRATISTIISPHGTESYRGVAHATLSDMGSYNLGPDAYLEHLRRVKAAVRIPSSAASTACPRAAGSATRGRSSRRAPTRVELNIYYVPTDPEMTAAQVGGHVRGAGPRRERRSVKIPRRGQDRARLQRARPPRRSGWIARGRDGAGALQSFYLPDFRSRAPRVVPRLTLSEPHELLVSLHRSPSSYGHIKAAAGGDGGVHEAKMQVIRP